MNVLLQIEGKAVKNAASLLSFSGHSELENGLFISATKELTGKIRNKSQQKALCGNKLITALIC